MQLTVWDGIIPDNRILFNGKVCFASYLEIVLLLIPWEMLRHLGQILQIGASKPN